MNFVTAPALVAALAASPIVCSADPSPDAGCLRDGAAAFAPLAFLVGEWVGDGRAEGTAGAGTDTVHFDLGCRVLVRRSHSTYPGVAGAAPATYDGLLVAYPDATSPGGLRADSYDSGAHVIHYALVAGTAPNVVQFVSEGTTSRPAFRLTYERHADALDVTFEAAPPGSAAFATVARGVEHPRPI